MPRSAEELAEGAPDLLVGAPELEGLAHHPGKGRDGERPVTVRDAGEGLAVVDGYRKGRLGIIGDVVGHELGKQRVTLARMLLHQPAVFLLDEPYTGLDQVAADLLDQIMADAKKEGRGILFSTHDLERGLAICDRALILSAGRLVYDLPRGEWKNLAGFMNIYAGVLTNAAGVRH